MNMFGTIGRKILKQIRYFWLQVEYTPMFFYFMRQNLNISDFITQEHIISYDFFP